jgi:hypothetical protein
MKHAIVFIVALVLFPAARVAAEIDADKGEQAVVLMEKFAAIVDANKDNCDAMGNKLTAFVEDNSAQIKKLKSGKPTTPEERRAFSEKYSDRMAAVAAKMMPGLKKCQSNAKVAAALKRATTN